MAALFQSGTQVSVVIDFAVENNPYRSVFIRHRLMSAAQVHNGQSTVSQPDAAIQVQAGVIRPPMCQSVAHCDKARFADVAIQLLRNRDDTNATDNSTV